MQTAGGKTCHQWPAVDSTNYKDVLPEKTCSLVEQWQDCLGGNQLLSDLRLEGISLVL